MDKKVSIIIPVYNTAQYLNSCLTSLVCQTYSNLELIVVDDGSTDNSRDIYNDFERQYSNIVIINKTNGGVSEARNCGLKSASGYYVMFVDSDDRLELDAVSNMVMQIENSQVDLVVCGYYKCNIQGNDITPIFVSKRMLDTRDLVVNFWKYFYAGMINEICNKIYKREIIQKNNLCFPKNIGMGEDGYFNVQYLKYCQKILMIDSCLYYYNQYPEQSSKKIFPNYFEMMMFNFDNIENLFEVYDCFNNEQLVDMHQQEIFNVIKHSVKHVVKNKNISRNQKIQQLKCIYTHCRVNPILPRLRERGYQNRLLLILFKCRLWSIIILIIEFCFDERQNSGILKIRNFFLQKGQRIRKNYGQQAKNTIC